MTGTSLDALDMAVLDTDGETIAAFGPAGEYPWPEDARALLLETTQAALSWARGTPEPAIFAKARTVVAACHAESARAFATQHGLDLSTIDLIGVHGQTVLHERPTPERLGRTVQLIDAEALSRSLGCTVVSDFRTRDVAHGGEGAPLAPIYHRARALASGITGPLAVLNIGGVANITFMPAAGDPPDSLLAFDTGPGNGPMDLLLQQRGLGRFDQDGRLAKQGRVDPDRLAAYLADPYFQAAPPKSLDRYDFSLGGVAGLSDADALATLAALTVAAVSRSLDFAPVRPDVLIVAGGGRHNPVLMAGLQSACAGVRVVSADDLGWRGDALEAEAFAYLAARSVRGLPLSFPGTTGVKVPLTGGTLTGRL